MCGAERTSKRNGLRRAHCGEECIAESTLRSEMHCGEHIAERSARTRMCEAGQEYVEVIVCAEAGQ